MKLDKRQDFKSDVVELFTALGQAIAQFNDEGEWVSGTINLTSDPQGEAPVISMVIYPGTTRNHAQKIQSGLGEFFSSLNK